MANSSSILDHIDTTTLLSLGAVLVLLNLAFILSTLVLSPTHTSARLRILFIWHFFDFLIHTIFEGSFLYNCFFASAPFDPFAQDAALLADGFPWGQRERLYGSAYADNWAGKLWMVYAQADRRWAGADLTVISLELLTVFGAGPLALWICYAIAKGDKMASFWMIVLATGEIYGGFMTFCPEWLTGNQNLDGSNFMFLWVYLVFFNMLWVFIPLYALYHGFVEIKDAFKVRQAVEQKQKVLKKA